MDTFWTPVLRGNLTKKWSFFNILLKNDWSNIYDIINLIIAKFLKHTYYEEIY